MHGQNGNDRHGISSRPFGRFAVTLVATILLIATPATAARALVAPVLSVGTVTQTTVQLNWTDGGNEQQYKVYKNSALLVTLPANTLTYTAINLTPDTTYAFRVDAKKGGQVLASNTVNPHTLPPPPPECSDGINNDPAEDSLIDFPADPGCTSASDTTESPNPPPPPECNDGINNDPAEDSLIDFPADPGCTSATDTTESPNPPPLVECNDGVNNDPAEDSLIDFPADPGCTSATDTTESPNPPVGEHPCLARPDVEVLPTSGSFDKPSYPVDHTFDARNYVSTAYPTDNDPVDIGRGGDVSGLNPCFVGGTLQGTQSRNLVWQTVKDPPMGGYAVIFSSDGNLLVDGLQVDNIEDGFVPQSEVQTSNTSGDGWVLKNAYFNYIRDDCIAGDYGEPTGSVIDSLFDGCFVFMSYRGNGPVQSNETITIDGAIIRNQDMPAGTEPWDPINGPVDAGGVFKAWDSFAPRLSISNTIILTDRASQIGELPTGTTLSNVTVVIGNTGSLSGSWAAACPGPGCTVTHDVSVYNNAKALWLTRHGCTAWGVCTKIINPDP